MGDTSHTSIPQPDPFAAQLGSVVDGAIVSAPPALDEATHAISIMPKLQTRVVREARRETWFVVNGTGDELATIPIELGGRGIRRVQVNGEVAEFSASPDLVLVRPRRALRAGAGTIVVIHFR